VLLATPSWMAAMAAALGALTIIHPVTPWLLLRLTFLLGLGAAINDPTWQAVAPGIVGPEQLASAGYSGLCAAGIGWIAMLASLNTDAHAQSPAWIRARDLSAYVLGLWGGMAVRSAAWSAIAVGYGPGTALMLVGAGLLAGLLPMRQYRLRHTYTLMNDTMKRRIMWLV
jgi:hypothetical protein